MKSNMYVREEKWRKNNGERENGRKKRSVINQDELKTNTLVRKNEAAEEH